MVECLNTSEVICIIMCTEFLRFCVQDILLMELKKKKEKKKEISNYFVTNNRGANLHFLTVFAQEETNLCQRAQRSVSNGNNLQGTLRQRYCILLALALSGYVGISLKHSLTVNCTVVEA